MSAGLRQLAEADDDCTFALDGTCRLPEDVCSNAGECLWDKTYQYEEPDE